MLENIQQLENLADRAGTLAEMNSAIKTPFYYSSKKIGYVYLLKMRLVIKIKVLKDRSRTENKSI